jgi:GNAT superfamily N-acetyltransferase
MGEDYQIIYVEKPGDAEWSTIGGGIGAYNAAQAGDDGGQLLCYVLQGADDTIAGGVIAAIYWDWLYVDLMWIREELRGQGYGRRLLTMVEEAAKQRGATKAYLDTFSFQAPGFYKKHGYEVFGALEDFPAGHRRYFLTKEL